MDYRRTFVDEKITDSEVHNSIFQTKTQKEKQLLNLELSAKQEEIVGLCSSNAKLKQYLSQLKIDIQKKQKHLNVFKHRIGKTSKNYLIFSLP